MLCANMPANEAYNRRMALKDVDVRLEIDDGNEIARAHGKPDSSP